MLFQLVLLKLSAVQKTVKLLWVAYLSFGGNRALEIINKMREISGAPKVPMPE
jgi:hypothetical protein